jgi:hypothetical protein
VAPGKVEEGGAHLNGAAPVKGSAVVFPTMQQLRWSSSAVAGVLRWQGNERSEETTTNRRESKCGRSSPRKEKNNGGSFNPGGSGERFGQEDKGWGGGGGLGGVVRLGMGKGRSEGKT